MTTHLDPARVPPQGPREDPHRPPRGHDRPAGAGADPAVPVPADGPGGPAADRHARRHRTEGAGQDRLPAAGLLPPATRWKLFFGQQAGNPATCATATSSPRRSPRPTAGSTSARNATPLSGRRHDHARNSNTAAAGLDLPAAAGRGQRLARRHRHAVDPGPGRSHPLPGLDLRRAGRHGDADRQRADRAGGAARGRGDAQQRQHLDAVRRHAGRAGRRDRRPGQPRAVRASGSPS